MDKSLKDCLVWMDRSPQHPNKWISGENRDNCFHLVEIWNGLFLENSYLVSIVSLGAGRHVYLAMVVGNDKSNNGKTLRSSCYK